MGQGVWDQAIYKLNFISTSLLTRVHPSANNRADAWRALQGKTFSEGANGWGC